jgi:hypothetical protein
MRQRRSWMSLAAVCAALLSACASNPTVRNTGTRSGSLADYQGLAVTVQAADSVRRQSGFESTSDTLLKNFVSSAKERNLKVLTAKTSDPLVLDVTLTITSFNHVSGVKRGMIGMLGGRAALNVSMTVTDRDTGAVLRRVQANDTSKNMQGIFSATTGRQADAIADQLVAAL